MEHSLEKPQAKYQVQNTFDDELDDLGLSPIQEFFVTYTERISDLLIDKNKKYGNSALNPVRVFSSSDTEEQIKVRIDDKLSRIKSSQYNEDEDVIDDLIGYLVLLKAKRAGF